MIGVSTLPGSITVTGLSSDAILSLLRRRYLPMASVSSANTGCGLEEIVANPALLLGELNSSSPAAPVSVFVDAR